MFRVIANGPDQTADSQNNIFGRTLNPRNLSLNAGGSSGGEGAIVAMRASLMGVGTDIGGSIRIPALCCGTYGFKPTASRIPYGGQAIPGRIGSPGVLAAAGPLTTSFRDMRLFMDTVIAKQPWLYDHSALHMPWRSVPEKQVLRIGVFPADPAFPLHPPVERAKRSALEKLKAAGHIVVEIPTAPSIEKANHEIMDYYTLDPKATSFRNIKASGEPVIKSVAESPFLSKRSSPLTLDDLWEMNAIKSHYLKDWHKVFVDNQLDVIVGQAAETTAVPHDTFGNVPYTTLHNYMDVITLIRYRSWPMTYANSFS